MIQRLQISNYAIIEELSLDFDAGLSIITGETGAGKSIVLGALSLILGGRADSKTLFDANRKCIIEGRFDVSAYELQSYFQSQDLDYDDEMIVRREITPSGKSRAFVNDTPVNLKVLSYLGSILVDLHQQFDTLYINDPAFQLNLLDALAGQRKEAEAYQREYLEWRNIKKKLQQLRDQQGLAIREKDFLAFQANEFAEAGLQEGEQEELESLRHRLSNADAIRQLSSGVFHYLVEGENAVSGQLLEMSQKLTPLAAGDSRLKEIYDRFESLRIELDEIAEELESFGEDIEINPELLAETEERLDLIYRLQNKHGARNVEELLVIQSSLLERMNEFLDLGNQIDKLENKETKQFNKLIKLGNRLREGRQKIAPEFCQKTIDLLAELSMQNTRMEARFAQLDQPAQHGLDEVQFWFSANAGSDLKKIKDAASGGELSRLALVTKSLVATAMELPTLVFDEIDSGVSGDVARKMGQILNRLSKHHQLIVITHSPQVASQADQHYYVYKQPRKDTQRTVTKVKELTYDERVRAIAVMLSQSPPGESALSNARELIG